MRELIVQAFQDSRDGYSADRVLCDPELNARFVEACKSKGLDETPSSINRRLLNIRKSGKLGTGTQKRTRFNDDEYRFAAEMATRHLERRDAVSLDEILIDPARAEEFDILCSDLCPGASSLQYRWSALCLRKQRGLTPETISHAIQAAAVSIHSCSSVPIHDISTAAGLYIFFDDAQTLYVGEASNLRSRLKKHLDHSDNKQLARWFWEHGFEKARIELHVMEADCSTRIRRSLELELIRSRRPAFNIQGADDTAHSTSRDQNGVR